MNYPDYKNQLKQFADNLDTGTDKPMRRMNLNDYTDQLVREINRDHQLSEKRKEYYANMLVNYCCKRHEK